MPARADAMPIAAPSSEQPPGRDAGVGARRRSEAAVRVRERENGGRDRRFRRPRCAQARFARLLRWRSGTARYSTERVRGAEPAPGSCRRSGCRPRRAAGGARQRLRRRAFGGAGLQGVPAERRRRKVHERRQRRDARRRGHGLYVRTISPQTAKALKKAGKDGKSLKRLVKAYGLRRVLESSHATGAAEPTAIGSAFDLGSGPTALLIVLAGTAVLLLARVGTAACGTGASKSRARAPARSGLRSSPRSKVVSAYERARAPSSARIPRSACSAAAAETRASGSFGGTTIPPPLRSTTRAARLSRATETSSGRPAQR